MSTDARVQLQPDSTGKSVRTIEVTALINGTPTVVEMQVIALADRAGNVIDDFLDYKWKAAVVDHLQAIRGMLALQNGQLDLTE